jgi:signal transduction histidine kinase
MLKLRDYPLSSKLTWMNMAVTATALVLACASFVTYDVATFRTNVVAYASSQAALIGLNSGAALRFNDQASIQQTLAPLGSAPNVAYAAVYTADGRPFAHYSREGGDDAESLPPLLSVGDLENYSFNGGQLALVRRIVSEGKPAGFAYIRISSQTLNDRLRLYVGIAAGVLVLSLLAALLVSSIFRRAVAEPIVNLAEVAQTISRDKQFSVRAAPAGGGNEVAVLINAFNDMLAQIQERESELQQAHDTLDLRVQQRTAELKQTEERLRALSGHLLRLQDQERRHIARELHDSTGQVLAAFAMNLALLQNESAKLSPAGLRAIDECLEMVHEMSRELRTMSHLLHPPLLDEAGLESALNWYVKGFAERSGIQAVLDLSPQLGRLPHDLEVAIFRIVQESLTNVHRHSGSAVARVRLLRDERIVRVEVRDEGKGFSSSNGGQQMRPGVGIQGMRERVAQLGGQLEVRSDHRGTVVVATFPLRTVTPEAETGLASPAGFA